MRASLIVLAWLLAVVEARGHYHVLLPDKSGPATGETVSWTFRFGHPYEHEFFDAAAPESVYVVHPDGTRTDLTKSVEKFAFPGAGGQSATGYRFDFTPPKRGDYTVVAVVPAVAVKGEDRPLKDVVKCTLHVATQNGWDRRAVDAKAAPVELLPLTRPYGLTPGSNFQCEFETTTAERKPIVRGEIEFEKYNPLQPKSLPSDEFITGNARTDRSGSVSISLPEAGWWAITAVHVDNKFRHRSTFWVRVAEPAK